jgi:hypothetical protein
MMAMDFKEFEAALNDVFRAEYGPKRDFDIRDQALVDGRTWYTVYCTHEASQWIRGQSRALWHEHIHKKWDVIHNTFDIDEKLYTMLALRWA